MIKNTQISSNLNQWNIEFDPAGFAWKEDWLFLADKTEDILQLSHVYKDGPVLDVGFYEYNLVYKIFIIHNSDWDNPTVEVVSSDWKIISAKVYELIDTYANG